VDREELAEPRLPWPSGWTPRRVIQTLEPFATDARRLRLQEVFAARISALTVLMDAPHDPHNGAAMLRTCDAFGIPELHIVPRDEKPLFARSVTRGSGRWVDVLVHGSVSEAVTALRDRGFALVATRANGELLPEDLARIPRVALLVGNEHDGLTQELQAAATHSVRVPMRGFVESLNVSVATAILLEAASRGRPGDLSAEAQELLYARGLFYSVQKASEILDAARCDASAHSGAS
jgi:tRNA (guanosine-2'-O-)-methyltransferase